MLSGNDMGEICPGLVKDLCQRISGNREMHFLDHSYYLVTWELSPTQTPCAGYGENTDRHLHALVNGSVIL